MPTTEVLGAELGGGQTNEGIGHETSAEDITAIDVPARGDVNANNLGILITILSRNEIR